MDFESGVQTGLRSSPELDREPAMPGVVDHWVSARMSFAEALGVASITNI